VKRRPFIFSRIFILALLLTVPMLGDGNRDESTAASQNDFQVRVLNTKAEALDMAALKTVSLKIAKLLREGKLEMTRVKIFAEHPIVKEAMADKTIEIASSEARAFVILVPIAHRGKRVIVKEREKTNDSYRLYSLPDDADVDLSACLKR
jgi:hypothetical protein